MFCHEIDMIFVISKHNTKDRLAESSQTTFKNTNMFPLYTHTDHWDYW